MEYHHDSKHKTDDIYNQSKVIRKITGCQADDSEVCQPGDTMGDEPYREKEG